MEKVRSQEYPPVLYWFTISKTPEGEAPENIREQWIGLRLPVREPLPAPDLIGSGVVTGTETPFENPIPVLTADSIVALYTEGKYEAAQYWEGHYQEVMCDFLIFEAREGLIEPHGSPAPNTTLL